MADFPTSLTSLTDITCSDNMSDTGKTGVDIVTEMQDEIEALEAKVGIDSSAVTTSHDYKLSEVTSTDKAVGVSATQTLTNKTLTAPRLNNPNINEAVALTATSTELNLAVGVTAGTAVASKFLAVDASKDLTLGTGDFTATDITSSNNLIMSTNNKAFQVKDSGGTLRTGLILDSSDLMTIGDSTNYETVLSIQAKCSTYLQATQTNLVDGVTTLVALDAETYDTGSDFNTGSSLFTAPVTGDYYVSGAVTFVNGVSDKHYASQIQVAGAQSRRSTIAMGTTSGGLTVVVEGRFAVTAGQTIGLYAISNAGVNTVDIQGGDAKDTYLHIQLVSD